MNLCRWLRRCFFRSADEWNLMERLIHWGKGIYWTVGLSIEGAFALGASGSGKSSTLIAFQTAAVMEAGYGVLVLTVKETPPDLDFYLNRARESGRENSVVLIGPGYNLGCNVLRLEMEAAKLDRNGGDLAANVAFLISTIVALSTKDAQADQTIWRKAGEDLVRHAVSVVYAATDDLRLDDLCDLMASLPQSIAQSHDPAWQRKSRCWQLLESALRKQPHNRNVALAQDYLLKQFPAFPPDTHNSIFFSVSAGGISLLRRDPLYSMFFAATDYTPAILRSGAIILCACPVQKYQEVGRIANCLARLSAQRMLQRQGKVEDGRPIAIIFDESQKTLTPSDVDFGETARSTRTATIAATLTLPTICETVGDDLAQAFLNYLQTQVFFQSSDRKTGEYLANRCGKITETKESVTRGADGKTTRTKHEEEVDALPSYAAHDLKTGGPAHNYTVEGFLTVNGKKLRHGLPYLRLKFNQRNRRPWVPGYVSVVARRRPAPDFRYLRKDV
jgi:hypothetical protein